MNEHPGETKRLWRCKVICVTCRKVLNTAHGVPESEKARVTLSAPLTTAGRCDHSTVSDVNFDTELKWELEDVSTEG